MPPPATWPLLLDVTVILAELETITPCALPPLPPLWKLFCDADPVPPPLPPKWLIECSCAEPPLPPGVCTAIPMRPAPTVPVTLTAPLFVDCTVPPAPPTPPFPSEAGCCPVPPWASR